jgi:hypothetical protein
MQKPDRKFDDLILKEEVEGGIMGVNHDLNFQ